MKWIHKQTGYKARTTRYEYPDQGAKVCYEVAGQQVTFFLPTEIVQADSNWEEVPDDRWLDFTLTAREFMEAFAMTITPSGTSHDAFVVKSKIDSKYVRDGKKVDQE